MTEVLDIAFGEGSLLELQGKDFQGGKIRKVAALDDGTVEGLPSIAILVEGNDGSLIVAETTWRLFYTAYRALVGRYGVPE